MKDTSISKKINKTINADRLLEILCFSVGEKIIVNINIYMILEMSK